MLWMPLHMGLREGSGSGPGRTGEQKKKVALANSAVPVRLKEQRKVQQGGKCPNGQRVKVVDALGKGCLDPRSLVGFVSRLGNLHVSMRQLLQ